MWISSYFHHLSLAHTGSVNRFWFTNDLFWQIATIASSARVAVAASSFDARQQALVEVLCFASGLVMAIQNHTLMLASVSVCHVTYLLMALARQKESCLWAVIFFGLGSICFVGKQLDTRANARAWPIGHVCLFFYNVSIFMSLGII
jgi:hypothetical protein